MLNAAYLRHISFYHYFVPSTQMDKILIYSNCSKKVV